MLCVKQKHKHEDTLFDFEVTAEKRQFAEQTDGFQSCALKTGANGDEVPPVPIPNTEVKLISVENTWLATAWEDRTVPVQITERSKTFSAYCSLAQSVERMTVNHDVVSSSLTGAANDHGFKLLRPWFFFCHHVKMMPQTGLTGAAKK